MRCVVATLLLVVAATGSISAQFRTRGRVALDLEFTMDRRSDVLDRLGEDGSNVPHYEVDVTWPKPLPNNWLIGQIGGLAVDKHDHVWVNQRPRSLADDEKGAVPNPPTRATPRSLCCKPAPSVMEFDAEGNLLQAWGGPEDPGKCVAPACIWPVSEHGIFVDDDDHVWVAGNGPTDRMLLEFSQDGKFLMMIGGSFDGPPDSNSKVSVGRAAGFFVDTTRKEIYVADGYLNGRVVKFNASTGAFLKAWGAYGNPPTDANPSPQPPDPKSPTFNRPVHCVTLARDGLVYVCDRNNNRIQVFNREGQFQRQFVFDPMTLGNGSIWSIARSPDKDQRFLIYADGENNFIRIVDRKSGEALGTFGRSGRNAGQFHWVHQIAIDSHSNLYTGEVDSAKRVQKFVPRVSNLWPYTVRRPNNEVVALLGESPQGGRPRSAPYSGRGERTAQLAKSPCNRNAAIPPGSVRLPSCNSPFGVLDVEGPSPSTTYFEKIHLVIGMRCRGGMSDG